MKTSASWADFAQVTEMEQCNTSPAIIIKSHTLLHFACNFSWISSSMDVRLKLQNQVSVRNALTSLVKYFIFRLCSLRTTWSFRKSWTMPVWVNDSTVQ